MPAFALVIILCVERFGLSWNEWVGWIREWDTVGWENDVFCVVSGISIGRLSWVGEEGMDCWDKIIGGEDCDDVLWESGEDIESRWLECESLPAVSASKVFKLLLVIGIVYCWRRLYWNSEDLDGEEELKIEEYGNEVS